MLKVYILSKLINVVLRKGRNIVMEKIIIKIVEELIENISPEIRSRMIKFLDQLEADARQTKTPWDDLAIKIAKAVIRG